MDERTHLKSSDGLSRQVVGGNIQFGDSQSTIICQVCNTTINLSDKPKSIVKCPNCKEATPLKGAPPGKQYVRCPCNCLLLCKGSATKVQCARPHCMQVIQLSGDISAGPCGSETSNLQRPFTDGGTFNQCQVPFNVTCGNCHRRHQILPSNLTTYTPNKCLDSIVRFLSAGSAPHAGFLYSAKCPYCHRKCSINQSYSRVRWVGYLILTCLFFLIALIVTASTTNSAKSNKALYFLWSVIYLIVIICAVRSLLFYMMPVSTFEVPVSQA